MQNGDLPAAGTADSTSVSFSQSVDDITALLSGPPEEATSDENQDNQQAEDQQATAEDDLVLDDEDIDGAEDSEDDSQDTVDSDKGRFVSDTAKVKLEDGTIMSIADLKNRTKDFQRDYTAKQEALSSEKKKFEEDKDFVGRHALDLAERRKQFLQLEQKWAPPRPDPAMRSTDPIGYMEAKDIWEEYQRDVQTLKNEDAQAAAKSNQQSEEEAEATKQAEAKLLFEKAPHLKNPKVYQQFWEDAVTTMAKYGFSPEELGTATSHKIYLAMIDLNRYRKALEKRSQVQTQIRDKPQMVQGQKRQDQGMNRAKQNKVRAETLRRTGTFEAGIAALMDHPDL